MDSAPRKIEILAPFRDAFDLTKAILFQPFDLAKWFTIGFAAFLAGLADATRVNPGFNIPDFNARTRSNDLELEAVRSQLETWLASGVIVVLVAVAIVAAVAVFVLFVWLGSRGRFMFIDCIVRNRGAIAEPWREYRREGNSLFLWSLLVTGASLVVAGIFALPLLVPYLTRGEFGDFGVGTLIYLVAGVALLVVAGFAVATVTWFMVPVMYRQRCKAVAAFMTVIRLIASDPGPFILYVLFSLLVLLGTAIVSCLVTCLTCCAAAIPYIGTVILLPLYVFYYGYALLFLRQFGPEYDVWAGMAALPQQSTPAAPPSEPPPVSSPSTEPPPLP